MRASRLVDEGVLPVGLPAALGGAIEAAESEQRPGITGREARQEPRPALARIVSDLESFRARHDLSRLVVVNVSSTEAPVEPHAAHEDPSVLMDALDRGLGVLPPSALYALAAVQTGRRVRGLHALGRRPPARDRGAGRGARGAAGGLGRQDRRDVHEVGARARRWARAT